MKSFGTILGNIGAIGFLLLVIVSCATTEKAQTPAGEFTYGDQITPMNLCSIPKEDRPEMLLGRPTEGQCEDDV